MRVGVRKAQHRPKNTSYFGGPNYLILSLKNQMWGELVHFFFKRSTSKKDYLYSKYILK